MPPDKDEQIIPYPWQVDLVDDAMERYVQVQAWEAYVRASRNASQQLRNAWKSALRESAYARMARLVADLEFSTLEIVKIKQQLKRTIEDAS